MRPIAFCFALAAALALHAADFPGAQWDAASPGQLGLDEAKLAQARDYALTGEGSGAIVFRGRLAMSWGDPAALYDLKSSSKSIGVTVLGLALADGRVQLDDPAIEFHPTFGTPPESNSQTGWLGRITLRQLATQTAGFEKAGGYTGLLFAPGTRWHYSDGGPNWLAECLTLVYRRDLNDVLFERVFTPLGIAPADIRWRKHSYRPDLLEGIKRREFGSGFSANWNAMARLGLLYLRDGWWQGERILPHSFIEAVRTTAAGVRGLPVGDPAHYGNASEHYGLLWWNNGDGAIAGLPRDAFWSWGLFDSLIAAVPSLDLVAVRAGKSWKREAGAPHYAVLAPFLEPIAAAAKKSAAAPYPPSPVIAGIEWAGKETIVRKARGSDNWPMTWADDDALYTACGDGNGFEPHLKEKLSLGLAKISGGPADFLGANIRSASAEAKGEGRNGRKPSGILCVDGVLYLLTRNVANAQLGWSADHGATWTWADWKFTESFGCPSFVNFGKDYAGARDGFVYVFSPDAASAYERVDRMVLARAPKSALRERAAYEFLVRLDASGQPVWNRDMAQRGAIFTQPGKCYRSSMSFNAALQRYLWCHTGSGGDTRFAGGFAIYDAPEPWGPWTTAYYTDKWDTGPGETMHPPPKWMNADGLSLHLVFSGDDSFSVRQGTLKLGACVNNQNKR